MTAWKHAFHYLSPSVLPGQLRGFNEPFQAGTGLAGFIRDFLEGQPYAKELDQALKVAGRITELK